MAPTAPSLTTYPSGDQPRFGCAVLHNGLAETYVRLTGELDLETAPYLGRCLDDLLTGACSQLIVDLRQVSFMDSAGLAVLAAARSTAARTERTLKLVRGQSQVERLLAISGLDQHFEFTRPSEVTESASVATPQV